MNEPTPSAPASSDPSLAALLRRVVSAKTIIHTLFWSWHAIWLFGVLFGLAPRLLPELVLASAQGQVPWGITGSAVALILLPCLTLAAGWRLRHDHWKLLRLFYGVGGVAFALLFVRLFLIREATAGVQLLLGTLAAGAAFYTAELFGGLHRLGRAAAVVRMVGYSALLIIGVYTGVTMGLYTVPVTIVAIPELASNIIDGLTRASLLRLLTYSPVLFAAAAFGLYSFTLMLGLPIAVAVLYTRGWWRGLKAWSTSRPRALGVGITAATIATWLLALVTLSEQPQSEAFSRLSARPVDAQAQADNLAHTEQIRAGLLNAYLSPHRYWGPRGNNIHLARLYRKAFGTQSDVMGPQRVFNALAAPLLYDGDSTHGDRAAAQVRYEQFFDQPLQQGEREAVITAVSATYDRTQAEAGLLDVGQRRVLLTEQAVHTRVEGDVAHFTLHEVYVNQTWEQQEVFYYFNLPEHAALTGLWLGDSDDVTKRFAPTVAPRGAAQQVYREQRARRIDPALVEQVGPRQYRLRAFPIPARDRRDHGEAAPLHLWMEWTVLHDGSGWPAPRLAEARNVYWEPWSTRRTIDGEPADHHGWLPPHFAGNATPAPHHFDLDGVRVRAVPVDPFSASARPDGRLAIVLETSLSMAEHAAAVQSTLARLAHDGYQADLYIAPSPWSAERPRVVPLAGADPHYYGGHTLVGALGQFDALRGDTDYAAILVLSDAGSFAFLQDDARPDGRARSPMRRGSADDTAIELTRYTEELGRTAAALANARFEAPVWLLHFGNLPHAYRDEVGDLLQRTHGGVATDLEALLTRLSDGAIDGYQWSFDPLPVEPASDATTPDATSPPQLDDAFRPIAARALISHLARQQPQPQLDTLDRIHAVAVEHRLVTPWSSMIVLVNDAQREALARASAAEDRFDREAESGVEATTTPGGTLQLAATPEPEEWLLLCMGLLALIIRMRSMRLAARPTAA